jgi:DNA polymerase V
VMTNRFREDQAQYSNARALALDEPTDDPIRVIRRAKELLRAIFRPGYFYKKAGVILLDLVSSYSRQGLLFEEFGDDRTRGFVDAVEEVAARYGPGGGFWAAQGIDQSWSMRREMRTPRYTTNWSEIPEIGENRK